MRRILRVFIFLVFVFGFTGPVAAFQPAIPDTGQTKCYDADGNELNPCPEPGEPFYGQEAQYQPQHPRSYTKLGLGGVELADDALPIDQGGPWLMTRDNVTGLIWEVKQQMDGIADYTNPSDADNAYTWYDSNPDTNGGDPGTPGDGLTTFDTEQFIIALNAANYGGFNDWRMPTNKELFFLANRGYAPAIDSGWFHETQSSLGYWSSTTRVDGTHRAWGVGFYYGVDHDYGLRATASMFAPFGVDSPDYLMIRSFPAGWRITATAR